MSRTATIVRTAVAVLLLSATAALAQPSSDQKAQLLEAVARARATQKTYTFQLVLLIAEVTGPSSFENVPANAQKALKDIQDFLPYKSYRLLDLAWLRSSGSAEAQLSGLDGQTLSAGIDFHAVGAPRSAEDPRAELEIRRLVIVPHRESTFRLQPPRDTAGIASAPQPVRPLLESQFGMRVGETVVVGTAKLDGPTKALVVLLSALP